MPATPHLVIAGGAGSLGLALAAHLAPRYRIIILSRSPATAIPNAQVLRWDGRTLGPWTAALNHAAALINLAGRSVNCRYNAKNKHDILHSRLDSTRILGQAVAASPNPPPVWLNASTATIYKHTYDYPHDDLTGEIGPTPEALDAFSLEVATAWEETFFDAPTPHTRKVALRAAMVLGHSPNSVLPTLLRLVRLGLGGKAADGRQYMSWIHEFDFCRAVEFLLTHDLHGPVNLAAPEPVPNADFMAALRRAAGIRFGLPAARWQLKIGTLLLATEAELIIKSRRVIPKKLPNAGFTFHFPTLQSALANLIPAKRTTANPAMSSWRNPTPAP